MMLAILEHLNSTSQFVLTLIMAGIIGFINVFDFVLLIIKKVKETIRKSKFKKEQKKEKKVLEARIAKKLTLAEASLDSNVSLFSPQHNRRAPKLHDFS